MWVSQTYLGCPDPNAKAFVYYLWEEYKGQQDVPVAIIDRLASVGRAFGSDVTLMAPIPGAQHEIRRELRGQGYGTFWREIGPKTPGLLLITKPLGELRPDKDEYVFFPLPPHGNGFDEAIRDVFQSLHQACIQILEDDRSKEPHLLRTIYDALILQPNFMGLGFDLKPIITRFTNI